MAIKNTDPAATPKLSANFGCPFLFKSFPHRSAASRSLPKSGTTAWVHNPANTANVSETPITFLV